jgi:hypothetical protein
VAAKHTWKDNGVIETRPVALRGVWMERDLLQGVIDGIQESLGLPIDHLVIDAKRRDARLYVDNMLHGLAGKVIRHRLIRKAAYSYMIGQAASIGLARAKVLEYRAGEYLLGRAENVYQESVFAGDVCGCFESVERVRAKAFRNSVGDTFILKIEAWPDGPEEERLELERSPEADARVSFQRCGRCGLPREAADWRWEYDKGLVFDGSTGRRIVFIDTGGINAVFRELASELGEEIPRIIADKTRRFYEELFPTAPVKTPDLRLLEVRGYGVPEIISPSPEELAAGLKVSNPFNPPMVAGAVAALCGCRERPPEWETEGAVMRVFIR